MRNPTFAKPTVVNCNQKLSNTTLKTNHYFFIGNIITSHLEFPIPLFDNFIVSKASTDEEAFIKEKLLENSLTKKNIELMYENEMVKNQSSIKFNQLDKNQFNYYIINTNGNSTQLSDLQLILSLSSLDLTTIFEVKFDNSNPTNIQREYRQFKLRSLIYYNDYSPFDDFEKKEITKETIVELSYLNNLIKKLDKSKFEKIDKALEDFLLIKDISIYSPFKILSYISILETLLTTSKFKSGNETALSYQLKKKIKLLDDLKDEQINYKQYFKGPDKMTLEVIIEKLYQYRNDIAHGNISDFESSLFILKNSKHKIIPFLKELVRRVLIIALEQPKFITNLQQC